MEALTKVDAKNAPNVRAFSERLLVVELWLKNLYKNIKNTASTTKTTDANMSEEYTKIVREALGGVHSSKI